MAFQHFDFYIKIIEDNKNLGLDIYLFFCNVSDNTVAIIRQNKSK